MLRAILDISARAIAFVGPRLDLAQLRFDQCSHCAGSNDRTSYHRLSSAQALYLRLSQPACNRAGIYRVRLGAISKRSGFSVRLVPDDLTIADLLALDDQAGLRCHPHRSSAQFVVPAPQPCTLLADASDACRRGASREHVDDRDRRFFAASVDRRLGAARGERRAAF